MDGGRGADLTRGAETVQVLRAEEGADRITVRVTVEALDPAPGMRVLDCCAAPGGKTFGIALAMGDRGEVVSCDVHPHKKGLIRAGAERLGLQCVSPRTADGTGFCPAGAGAVGRGLGRVQLTPAPRRGTTCWTR